MADARRMIAPGDADLPHVADVELDFVRIEHAVRLQFGGVEVVILGLFTLRTATGQEIQLDAERRGQLGPLLELYPDRLAAIGVEADATLRLGFASGAAIAVPRDQRYEAWHVVGPGDRLIVCTPEGSSGLAVWW